MVRRKNKTQLLTARFRLLWRQASDNNPHTRYTALSTFDAYWEQERGVPLGGLPSIQRTRKQPASPAPLCRCLAGAPSEPSAGLANGSLLSLDTADAQGEADGMDIEEACVSLPERPGTENAVSGCTVVSLHPLTAVLGSYDALAAKHTPLQPCRQLRLVRPPYQREQVAFAKPALSSARTGDSSKGRVNP